MSAPINYQAYPKFHLALSAADAGGYDGASATQLLTGTASGLRDFLYLVLTPTATTTLGNIIRMFVTDGTTKVPIGDWDLRRLVADATSLWREPILLYPKTPGPVRLTGTADRIYISQEKADTLKMFGQCGDYQ